MNGLRRLGQKFRYGLQRFMEGRYGTDKLNMAILCAACAIVLIYTFFVPEGPVRLALWAVSYALMVWAICRTLSRKTYRRYEENRKFLQFWTRLKDRQHRYFDCPECRQMVRVPRGKGKIAITCPRCREKFVKKT